MRAMKEVNDGRGVVVEHLGRGELSVTDPVEPQYRTVEAFTVRTDGTLSILDDDDLVV
jgi:hypothetical protein